VRTPTALQGAFGQGKNESETERKEVVCLVRQSRPLQYGAVRVVDLGSEMDKNFYAIQ
jgi:hypothetical protein